jgi:hypothetical protein
LEKGAEIEVGKRSRIRRRRRRRNWSKVQNEVKLMK